MSKLEREELESRIVQLIPEFNLIQDEGLREISVDAWCDAMEFGEWEPEDLDNMPFTLLIDPCPATFLKHTRAVTQTAITVAKTLEENYGEKMPINMDYLISGAILHDVGKLLEYKKTDGKVGKSPNGKLLRHPFSGTAICFAQGLPDEILHIIAMHSKEGDMGKRITESIIVHHADFINFEPFH